MLLVRHYLSLPNLLLLAGHFARKKATEYRNGHSVEKLDRTLLH